MSYTFAGLMRVAQTARDPFKGKPTQNNTYVRIIKGSEHNPEIVGVQFHETDILKYYEDGSMEVYDGHLSSPTTNGRIWQYSDIRRYKQLLPTYNGRLPNPQKLYCISQRGGSEHIVANSYNGYIRYQPDGSIDLTSVKPIGVSIISDPKGLRALIKKGKQICDLINGAQRLGFWYSTSPMQSSFDNWMIEAIKAPLEQCVAAEAPSRFATFKDGLLIPEQTLSSLHRVLAQEYGYTKVIELKAFTR